MTMRPMSAIALAAAVLASTASASAQAIDWSKVDEAFGRKAAVSGDVHRYGFPRTDLTVTVDGVTIKPAFALGGWIAMKPAHEGAMVMGDLVLLESEINPVMTVLIQNGLEITAVHNHILRGSPATFYMHVGGHGDPAKLASTIVQALQSSKTPLTPPAAPAGAPAAVDLDTAQLDQIIGVKGSANGGVYQFGVPRRDPVTEGGMQIAPAGPMGVATAINFQPTGGAKGLLDEARFGECHCHACELQHGRQRTRCSVGCLQTMQRSSQAVHGQLSWPDMQSRLRHLHEKLPQEVAAQKASLRRVRTLK